MKLQSCWNLVTISTAHLFLQIPTDVSEDSLGTPSVRPMQCQTRCWTCATVSTRALTCQRRFWQERSCLVLTTEEPTCRCAAPFSSAFMLRGSDTHETKMRVARACCKPACCRSASETWNITFLNACQSRLVCCPCPVITARFRSHAHDMHPCRKQF